MIRFWWTLDSELAQTFAVEFFCRVCFCILKFPMIMVCHLITLQVRDGGLTGSCSLHEQIKVMVDLHLDRVLVLNPHIQLHSGNPYGIYLEFHILLRLDQLHYCWNLWFLPCKSEN
ncbi:hypothetical protein SAY87_030470 [Trapa incisa]|uniref:Uncharacterized protein n=1 Tax=Trapa incisa TaxID=236973 RepID=A0AAN7QLT8_9MYRT|nr:hypothetical protein SAY87_030470 [Trapa incisa]